MNKPFSSSWKSSKKPTKQRKYRDNAPLGIRRAFLNAILSRELRKKYLRRSFPIRKGDQVKILIGDSKNKIGKVNRVNLKMLKIYIEGIEKVRRDGTKAFLAIEPSNVMIQELNIEDKLRRKALERKISVKKNASN